MTIERGRNGYNPNKVKAVFRPTDLSPHRNHADIKGWELESKINLYMYNHKKKVFWVPHSGINTHWKWGWNVDLIYHKKKMSDIYSIGLINLIRLYLFFGKKKYTFNLT